MDRRKLLERLTQDSLQNVAFRDLARLAEGFGFTLTRKSGSHHIFSRASIPELLNLQDVAGQAKPYQIRQLLRIVEKYNLKLED